MNSSQPYVASPDPRSSVLGPQDVPLLGVDHSQVLFVRTSRNHPFRSSSRKPQTRLQAEYDNPSRAAGFLRPAWSSSASVMPNSRNRLTKAAKPSAGIPIGAAPMSL